MLKEEEKIHLEKEQLRRNKINYTTCIVQIPTLPAAHNVLIKCDYHDVISFHSNHTGRPANLASRNNTTNLIHQGEDEEVSQRRAGRLILNAKAYV